MPGIENIVSNISNIAMSNSVTTAAVIGVASPLILQNKLGFPKLVTEVWKKCGPNPWIFMIKS